MGNAESTCWTVIQAAASGDRAEREEFARRYDPVIREVLRARWAGTPRASDVDDAVQDVFLECLKDGGALGRADTSRPGGFRPYLRGVVRNVALRYEAANGAPGGDPEPDAPDVDAVVTSERGLSRAFDRAWARYIMREAAGVMARRARSMGRDAERRVDLLHFRFHEDLPIRDIAARWQADPAVLHHEYATARREFREALTEVVAFHHPGPPVAVETECAELLGLLN
ncbi:MAG: sigma-70 family RNA polymerase sigma factor [Planctomycetes bacterium]|nr:sigma-70 family RNA polymerase sigma factor [Planctomycetota bacterium]